MKDSRASRTSGAWFSVALPMMIAACAAEPQASFVETPPPPPPFSPSSPSTTPPGPASVRAEALTRIEWEKAENRRVCAPVGFRRDGDRRGTARAANFGGGWAVAFDLPDMRSAYGVAGVGSLPRDADPPEIHRRRLRDQWPRFRELDALPAPSFAGYGLSGAKPWPAGREEERGPQSLAYVRIAGQRCDYNVWSRLGRAHLETLLDNLRLLPEEVGR